jgi:hypothetical protein
LDVAQINRRRARTIEILDAALMQLRREGIAIPEAAMVGSANLAAVLREELGLESAQQFLRELIARLPNGTLH